MRHFETRVPDQQEMLDKMIHQTARLNILIQKLMSLTRYEIKEYAGGVKIIDITKASGL